MIELKKYAHVNKKALDQFLQFSDERDKLTNRKAEIDEAHRVCSTIVFIVVFIT